jgi:FAD/FMN-containing dehydrogenase
MDPGILEIMARIKTEFDPEDLLNPGRFVGGL